MSGSELPLTTDGHVTLPLYCEHGDADAVQDYRRLLPIKLVPRAQWPDRSGADCPLWWLQFERGRLRLLRAGDSQGVCVSVEDVRRRAVRQSELARACGLGTGAALRVLDGTGGWGVDALCLAQLGAEVTVLERLPPMWALLADLVDCAGLSNITLHCADLWDWLPEQRSSDFDVVYLDPMFAPRKKSAAPNKRLQYLAELVRTSDNAATSDANAVGDALAPLDIERWLQLCQPVARERIVIKRRRHDPPLTTAPTWQIKGRSVRYDVVDPSRLPALP